MLYPGGHAFLILTFRRLQTCARTKCCRERATNLPQGHASLRIAWGDAFPRELDTGGTAPFLAAIVVAPCGAPGQRPRWRLPQGSVTRLAAGPTVAGVLLADYYALLAYAAANLDKNTAAVRRALYERARISLVTQIRKLDPPLTESEIRQEQLALEEAIRKLEADKLSRFAQHHDPLIGNLNELVQKLDHLRQRMPISGAV